MFKRRKIFPKRSGFDSTNDDLKTFKFTFFGNEKMNFEVFEECTTVE